jgi:hypothetical protein
MAGERVDLVNEYKVSTGQPLSGSMQIAWKIAKDEQTGRKKIIRNPETEEAVYDVLDFYTKHQSKKKALVYLHTKHQISMSYISLCDLLKNPMLYGFYRDNPAYCEAYMDKEAFDRLQDISKRNVKANTAENRAYLFSGLIKCPECGRTLIGNVQVQRGRGGEKMYYYKRYRCGQNRRDAACGFKKSISENVFEKMMLKDIEKYMEEAKIRSAQVTNSDNAKIMQYDIEEIYERIDRLNYSWNTGKIRTVEKYEADYAELMELLEKAEAERNTVEVEDFGKIEAILHSGWEAIYNNLDDAYKRAFWRSFIQSIEINWTTSKKEIARVNFF